MCVLSIVSRFLPFICISFRLHVFKFDTGILPDLCAVPLLKTLSRLPQSIAFLCLILFLVFACNNFPFRAFVTMTYWTSTEVLLNLVAPLDCKSMFFELLVLIPLVLYLIRSMLAEVSENCISRIRLKCSFFWPWENQYMVHGFDSISIAQFPAMICSVSAEGSLNRVAHSISMFLLLTLRKSFLFILCAFDACLPLSSA